MRELHQHLLSVLMIGLMAFGASGWRAVHMLQHDSSGGTPCGHACAPNRAPCPSSAAAGQAHTPGTPTHDHAPGKGHCLTCEHLDALTGAPPAAAQVPTFVELVCVTDDVAPGAPVQPAPPRVAGARPPPIL